jgi:hypothetical protein
MFETMSATVLCFGEILLRLASPNKELLLQSARFDVQVGGAEANVAVSLSRFGHSAGVVSTLPESPLGRACADGRDPLLRRPHGSVFPDSWRGTSAGRSVV